MEAIIAKGKAVKLTYVVKAGDTLKEIARQHLGTETKLSEIIKSNNWLKEQGRVIGNNVFIKPGDHLVIMIPEEEYTIKVLSGHFDDSWIV